MRFKNTVLNKLAQALKEEGIFPIKAKMLIEEILDSASQKKDYIEYKDEVISSNIKYLLCRLNIDW